MSPRIPPVRLKRVQEEQLTSYATRSGLTVPDLVEQLLHPFMQEPPDWLVNLMDWRGSHPELVATAERPREDPIPA